MEWRARAAAHVQRGLAAGVVLALAAAVAPAAAAELPDDIERALQTDERVLDCPAGTRDGVSLFAEDWVAVQRIDLNDDARPDWLLRGLHPCLRRDGGADWWLYAQQPQGRRLLGVQRGVQSLEVLPSRTGGWRDLRVRDRGGVRIVRYRGEGY